MAVNEAVEVSSNAVRPPLGLLTEDVIADLSHFGLIEVSGDEAQKYLASLFTGDVKKVSASAGQFTSWCDGKGRMLATFWLFSRAGAYYLLLPAEQVGTVVARMRQFLLRTKATITDVSSALARIGLAGPSLSSKLAAPQGAVPGFRGETVELGGCTVLALSEAPQSRWLVVGEAEAVDSLRNTLGAGLASIDADGWALLDILGGIPFVVSETSGEFIPQMFCLETLGGLSFTKGCYPGQEVVARLQYRGQLKRRIYLGFAQTDAVPAPGTKLYGEGTTESVGMVVSAARDSAGDRVALLAVVVIEQRSSGPIHLESADGVPIVFSEADPYAAGPAES
jgi:tRNA-modifying protein YgfZ